MKCEAAGSSESGSAAANTSFRPISINTDDPKMFGNSLAEEFQMLEDRRFAH